MITNNIINQIVISIDDKSIPVFEKDSIPFIRKENKGFISFILPNSRHPIFKIVNPTAVYILSLIDGNNTTEDIYNVMKSEYKGTDIKTIKKDLCKILKDFWMNGLITWRRSCTFMENFKRVCDDGSIVKVAFDEDINLIADYLAKNVKDKGKFRYINPLIDLDVSSSMLIRSSLFNMSYIYFILQNDNSTNGIIILKVPSISNTSDLELFLSNSVNISDFWEKSMEMINEASISKLSKVRAMIERNQGVNNIVSKFKDIGFEQIALLRKEKGDSDLIMLDYYLNKTIIREE